MEGSTDNQNEELQSTPQNKKSWKESFANAAKSTGILSGKFAILAGTFMTGAGLAFTLTNMNNNNEKQIIDSATSSNPIAPITVSIFSPVSPSTSPPSAKANNRQLSPRTPIKNTDVLACFLQPRAKA